MRRKGRIALQRFATQNTLNGDLRRRKIQDVVSKRHLSGTSAKRLFEEE